MTNLYYASPLFTEGERLFNTSLVERIKSSIIASGNGLSTHIYVPQENMTINDKSVHASPIDIFDGDANMLLKSDIVIAVLDGQVIDPGVALEIGMAVANDIPVFALCSDIRTDGYDNKDKVSSMARSGNTPFFYYNQMVVGAVESMGAVCRTSEELVEKLTYEVDLLNKEAVDLNE